MPRDPALASFMYHEITDDPTTTGFQRRAARRYTCTPAQFERHLDLIAVLGARPATVDRVALDAPAREILLTFDDGGESARRAGEALLRRGWRGHFFIVTSRIGSRGFLDASAIRRLREDGHVIGSHSATHPDVFPDLTIARMREEWTRSRDALEQLLGEHCTVASIPGGDLSPDVARSAAESGVEVLFTSEPWRRPRLEGGCWLVGRLPVTGALPDRTFARLAALHGWEFALLRRRCSVFMRRRLGPLYRQYVRITTAGDPSKAAVL